MNGYQVSNGRGQMAIEQRLCLATELWSNIDDGLPQDIATKEFSRIHT